MEQVEQARTTSAQEPGASTLRQSVSLSGPAADKSSSGESVDSIESLPFPLNSSTTRTGSRSIRRTGFDRSRGECARPDSIPGGMERAFAADLSGVRAYCGASALLADSGVRAAAWPKRSPSRLPTRSTCGGT